MDTDLPVPPPGTLDVVLDAFSDPDDLVWNRQGRFSPSQEQMLRSMHRAARGRRKVVLVLLLLAPVAAVAYVMVTSSATSRGSSTGEAGIPWIVPAAMAPFIGLILLIMWIGKRRGDRLANPVLRRAVGPVRKTEHGTSPGSHLRTTTVRIGDDFKLRVMSDDADGITEGASYEAYYVEGETTILLSLSRLT